MRNNNERYRRFERGQVKRRYDQKFNTDCNDWRKLEQYKPVVANEIETENIFRKCKGKGRTSNAKNIGV